MENSRLSEKLEAALTQAKDALDTKQAVLLRIEERIRHQVSDRDIWLENANERVLPLDPVYNNPDCPPDLKRQIETRMCDNVDQFNDRYMQVLYGIGGCEEDVTETMVGDRIPQKRRFRGRLVEYDNPAFLRLYLTNGELDGRKYEKAEDFEGIGIENFRSMKFSPDGVAPVKGQAIIVWCINHRVYDESMTQSEIVGSLLEKVFNKCVDIARPTEAEAIPRENLKTYLKNIHMKNDVFLTSSEQFVAYSINEIFLGTCDCGQYGSLGVRTVLERAGYAGNGEGLESALVHCYEQRVKLRERSSLSALPIDTIRQTLATGTLKGKPCNTFELLVEAGARAFVRDVKFTYDKKIYTGVSLVPSQSYEEWSALLQRAYGESARESIEKYEASRPMLLCKKPELLREFMRNGAVIQDGVVVQQLNSPKEYISLGVGNIAQSRKGNVVCTLSGYTDVKVVSLMQQCGGQNRMALITLLETAFGPQQFWDKQA